VADAFEAGARVGIVADDISHADIIGDALTRRVVKHRLEGFEVGVNVTKKSDPHENWTIGPRKNCRFWSRCRDEIDGAAGPWPRTHRQIAPWRPALGGRAAPLVLV